MIVKKLAVVAIMAATSSFATQAAHVDRDYVAHTLGVSRKNVYVHCSNDGLCHVRVCSTWFSVNGHSSPMWATFTNKVTRSNGQWHDNGLWSDTQIGGSCTPAASSDKPHPLG